MTHVGEELALRATRRFRGMLCPAALDNFLLQCLIGLG